MTAYPDAFYVAHKLYSGAAFPKPTWGDVLDGPMTSYCDVVTRCFDRFDDLPTRDVLRVWHVENGMVMDVTADIIGSIADRMEALYE